MSEHICPSCGQSVPADAAFCTHCGASMNADEPKPQEETPVEAATVAEEATEPAEETTPVEAVTEVSAPKPAAPAPVLTPAPKQPKPIKKRPWWLKGIITWASLLFAGIAIVVGIAIGGAYLLGSMSSGDAMKTVVNNLDFTEMKLVEVEGEKKTISEAVYESISEEKKTELEITQETVDGLMEMDFVKEYMGTTMGAMMESMITGEALELSSDELKELITENRDEIKEKTGMEVDDETIDGMVESMKLDEMVEEVNTMISKETGDAEQEENPLASLRELRDQLSGGFIWTAIAIQLALIVLILLVNTLRPAGLTYAGLVCLGSGALFGLINLLYGSILDMVAAEQPESAEIAGAILSIITEPCGNVFLLYTVLGVALIAGAIVYTVVRNVRRKKAQAAYDAYVKAQEASEIPAAAEVAPVA